MEFANDEKGTRTSIFDADKEKKYFCPCCGSEMIQKKGQMLIWHFAHKTTDNCVSYYDNKGQWHRKMQDLFPEKNREIYNNDFGRHFYDVLTDNNRIIEFQHSPISQTDFDKRTDAYNKFARSKGAKDPIWVFDYTSREFYADETNSTIRFPRNRRLHWSRANHNFENYDPKICAYELWFKIFPWGASRPGYARVKRAYGSKTYYADVFTELEFERYLLNQ